MQRRLEYCVGGGGQEPPLSCDISTEAWNKPKSKETFGSYLAVAACTRSSC